jgi:hypothetical protein
LVVAAVVVVGYSSVTLIRLLGQAQALPGEGRGAVEPPGDGPVELERLLVAQLAHQLHDALVRVSVSVEHAIARVFLLVLLHRSEHSVLRCGRFSSYFPLVSSTYIFSNRKEGKSKGKSPPTVFSSRRSSHFATKENVGSERAVVG